MKLNIITIQLLLLASTSLFISCKKDPVKGCTDTSATNFKPDAEEDDGTCTYMRDKIIGSWGSTTLCNPGNVDSYNMNILADPNDKESVRIIGIEMDNSNNNVIVGAKYNATNNVFDLKPVIYNDPSTDDFIQIVSGFVNIDELDNNNIKITYTKYENNLNTLYTCELNAFKNP